MVFAAISCNCPLFAVPERSVTPNASVDVRIHPLRGYLCQLLCNSTDMDSKDVQECLAHPPDAKVVSISCLRST